MLTIVSSSQAVAKSQRVDRRDGGTKSQDFPKGRRGIRDEETQLTWDTATYLPKLKDPR